MLIPQDLQKLLSSCFSWNAGAGIYKKTDYTLITNCLQSDYIIRLIIYQLVFILSSCYIVKYGKEEASVF